MFVVAMESYCMKIVMINLVDNSDFLLSQNTFQIIAVILADLEKSEDSDFSCIKLTLQKVPVGTLLDDVLSRPKQAVSFSSQNY